MRATESIDRAIERYSIYLGAEQTLRLHQAWKKVEKALASLLVIDIMQNNPRRFKDGIEPPMEDRPESYGTMLKEWWEINIQARTELNSVFDELPVVSLVTDPPVRDAASILSAALRRVRESHARKEQALLNQLRDDPDPIVAYLSGRSGRIADFLVELVQQRHQLLEPAINAIDRRRSTRGKSKRRAPDCGRYRDTGTRDLLRVALATKMDTKALAERLVTEDLDRKPTGSRAKRIRRETERLNTRLKMAQKAMEPGFPSPQNQ